MIITNDGPEGKGEGRGERFELRVIISPSIYYLLTYTTADERINCEVVNVTASTLFLGNNLLSLILRMKVESKSESESIIFFILALLALLVLSYCFVLMVVPLRL